MPKEYPDMKYYHRNEMDTDFVIEVLKRLKLHNPGCFNIFYGGEPALRKDLPEIIIYCNKNDIPYTIITNNTDRIQPMLKTLLNSTSHVMGLSSSVDPMVIVDKSDADRIKKSDG
jgi:MoaA/NifB/PqqE/SkfB family radical SAM enzyme